MKWACALIGLIAALSWCLSPGCRKESTPWWASSETTDADESPQARPQPPPRNRPSRRTPPTRPSSGPTITANLLRVNGETISVQQIMADLLPALREKARRLPPHQYRKEARDSIAKEIMDAITELLVYREAMAKTEIDEPQGPEGISPLDRAVALELSRKINRVAQGSQARYEKYLADLGTNLEEHKAAIRRHIVVQRYLREKLLPKVNITRRDLQRYYQAHIDQYQWPRKVEVFMIEVWIQNYLPSDSATGRPHSRPTPEQWAVAERRAGDRARRIMDELKVHGIDFLSVCKTYSDAPNKFTGGRWVITKPIRGRDNEMLAPTEAALKMVPGEISQPIRSGKKLFIVKVGQVTAAGKRSFRQVQPAIRKELEHQQIRKLSLDYEAKLRNKAAISPVEPFFQACYLAAPYPSKH